MLVLRHRFRRAEKPINLGHLRGPITIVRPYFVQSVPGDVCSHRLFTQCSLQGIGQASSTSLGEKAVLLVLIKPCRAGIMDADRQTAGSHKLEGQI